MALPLLSSISARHFSGNSRLTDESASGLRALLNEGISKINDLIQTAELETLSVGSGPFYYYVGHSWMVIDGVNPPTFSCIWLQDQTTGQTYELAVDGGVLGITPRP